MFLLSPSLTPLLHELLHIKNLNGGACAEIFPLLVLSQYRLSLTYLVVSKRRVKLSQSIRKGEIEASPSYLPVPLQQAESSP